MRKSDFWFFMASWAISEDKKRKAKEMQHQRQESKDISQQIRRRNISKSLKQHRYMHLSKKSR